MRKIFLSFLMVLIIQPVFAGKRICCGIDPDTFIIKNVEIEGPALLVVNDLFSMVLSKQVPQLNIVLPSDFSELGDDYNKKISFKHKKVTLTRLLEELKKKTGIPFHYARNALIIGRFIPLKKQKIPKEIRDILIPEIDLPPDIKIKDKKRWEWERFNAYFKAIENASKKYDKSGKGIKIDLIYKTGKDEFGHEIEDWMFNIYYRLPVLRLKNIHLDELIVYLAVSSGLKYEIQAPNTIRIFSFQKTMKPKILFSLPRKYLNNKNKLFMKYRFTDPKTKKEVNIDPMDYNISINPGVNPLYNIKAPVNAHFIEGVNIFNLEIYPPKSFDLLLELVFFDSNKRVVKKVLIKGEKGVCVVDVPIKGNKKMREMLEKTTLKYKFNFNFK